MGYKIAVIPGDGIGPEVIDEGLKVLNCVAQICKIDFEYTVFSWGSDYYHLNGHMMPKNALDVLKVFDAIYVGAIGDTSVPDSISVRLIIDLRMAFDQYANVRPIKGYEGSPSYLRHVESKDIDFVVVRENTEGEYSNAGGRVRVGTGREIAVQTSIFTRLGTERVMRYAFELARERYRRGVTRRAKVTSCTKSNALAHSMVFWDEVFEEVAREYPDVETNKAMVDALAMWFIKNPCNFDVVVASNLFGDILTDLAAILQGGLGFAAGGNINPDKRYPSMFEPIHGSAPKYKGMNLANPIATILAGKMMLEHLGEQEAGNLIEHAVIEVLREGTVKTKDMGGGTKTSEVGEIICRTMLACR